MFKKFAFHPAIVIVWSITLHLPLVMILLMYRTFFMGTIDKALERFSFGINFIWYEYYKPVFIEFWDWFISASK